MRPLGGSFSAGGRPDRLSQRRRRVAAEDRLRPRPPILYPLRLPPPRPFGAPIHLGKGRPLVPPRDIRGGVLLGRRLHPRPRGRRPVAGEARSAEVDPGEGMRVAER